MLVQEVSAGRVQVEPVKPLEQTHRQEPEMKTLIPSWEQGAVELQEMLAEASDTFLFGRTIKVTGMTTAAAMRRMRMIVRRAKAQMGIPQHLRERSFSSYEVSDLGTAVCVLERPDFCLGEGHREPARSPVGVAIEGEGKAASMSDIDPGRDPRGD